MRSSARLVNPHALSSVPRARRHFMSQHASYSRMTPPRRHLNPSDVKAIVDALAKQMGGAYLPSTGEPFQEIMGRLDKIDVRLDKIEEQNKEHLPLIKSLHSGLSAGKGFGKFLTWVVALAAASATAWTAIKAILQAKTG